MTYDRMKAKKIKGEFCRFCGDSTLPLVKTQCCEQWTCCDKASLSYRGGGYCQFQHEHYSLCYDHWGSKHKGLFSECDVCKKFWGSEYESKVNDPSNYPQHQKAQDKLTAKLSRLFNG